MEFGRIQKSAEYKSMNFTADLIYENLKVLYRKSESMSEKSILECNGWIESFGTKCLLIFDPRENISNASKSMD